MQVTQNRKDDLNLSVSIVIEKADYADLKKKRLNNYRAKADLKGFRKGMAPMGIIEKMYGGQALAEAINTIVGEQLQKFVEDNKLNILGEPLPSEVENTNDWDNGETFTFDFDLGLRPEISFVAASEDVVPQYTIKMTDKAIADYKESMLKQIGHLEEDETKENGKKLVAAEENQEAYDKLFGEGNVKSTEEFTAKVTEMLQKEYEQESEYRFGIDARNYAIEKAAIALPEEFLKRWLHSANEGKFTMEQIEAEFGAFVKDFRWQLIRDNVMLAQDFKISSEDVMNEAKSIAQYQFAMYGMTNMPDEDIAKFAVQMLQDQEQARRIYEKLQNDKVVGYIRNTVTVENKEISVEELREMGR